MFSVEGSASHDSVARGPANVAGASARGRWVVSQPSTDFEKTYYNWFRVSPTLLFEVLNRESINPRIRNMVMNNELRDPALDYDSIDEDFYIALTRVV